MVKRFVDDETLPWDERFKRLEAHHIDEVTELSKKHFFLQSGLAMLLQLHSLDIVGKNDEPEADELREKLLECQSMLPSSDQDLLQSVSAGLSALRPEATVSGKRMETGLVQFGDDWPGIFIRGDNAQGIAMHLQMLRAAVEDDASVDVFVRISLDSIIAILTSCDARTSEDVLKLRAFDECKV